MYSLSDLDLIFFKLLPPGAFFFFVRWRSRVYSRRIRLWKRYFLYCRIKKAIILYRILILRKLVHIFGESLKMNKMNIFKQIFTRFHFLFFFSKRKNFIPPTSHIYLYLFPPIEVGKTRFRRCEIIFFFSFFFFFAPRFRITVHLNLHISPWNTFPNENSRFDLRRLQRNLPSLYYPSASKPCYCCSMKEELTKKKKEKSKGERKTINIRWQITCSQRRMQSVS